MSRGVRAEIMSDPERFGTFPPMGMEAIKAYCRILSGFAEQVDPAVHKKKLKKKYMGWKKFKR